ncbi:MAG: Single-strand binding protein family [Solirubrobacteraceae bacterium]|jgi:hypothetical protein|nr:Single-strand binding protein family [Solirubrobacteraceae bacterium]
MARRKSTTASAPKAKAPEPKLAETKPAEDDTTLVGRLVADPVLRHTRSGLPVATIRIAVNDGDKPTFPYRVEFLPGRSAAPVAEKELA